MHTAKIHQLRTLLSAAVERLGFDLVAVEWVGSSHGAALRLSIDRTEGVSIRDCTQVSHAVSPVLDAEDPIEGAYTLEVSSPGIRRPVQRKQDFVAFSGLKAKLRLVEGHPRRRFTGILGGMVEDHVLIEVDGVEHRLFFDDVEVCHLVLSLDEYQTLPDILAQAPASGQKEVRHDDQ